jgi:signal transduction histidine kinase
MDRLFDPFWQAQKTACLGYGLGLKIAKCIVEAHGGALSVESVLEGGTTFTFTLPVANGHASGHGNGNGHGDGNGHAR